MVTFPILDILEICMPPILVGVIVGAVTIYVAMKIMKL